MPLRPGLSAKVSHTVAADDTAESVGTGDVPVFATPRLVALCERAAVAAVEGLLGEGETTVGSRVQVDHVAPVPVGDGVTAEATLEKAEGRRLVFKVTATDGRRLVGAGKVTRVVVDRSRFLDRLT